MSSKHLARTDVDLRHDYFGYLNGSNRGRYSEGWRFPLVDGYRDNGDDLSLLEWNQVTFVYLVESGEHPQSVNLLIDQLGSHTLIPLERVEQSKYWAVTLKMPSRTVYQYLYQVDGDLMLDPVNTRDRLDDTLHNPITSDDTRRWSYFWTDYCQDAVTFERWESNILQRITRHILPFNSLESRIFMQNFDPSKQGASGGKLYRMDMSLGVVNYIDKVLAGAEQHHREGYKTCLNLINSVLRERNPYQEPRDVSEDMYLELYHQMQSGIVPGWDYSAYTNPSYFIGLLRRHSMTGAFCHPKYGGNVGCFGWDYLAERFEPFDWRQGVEKPWGTNEEYNG